MWLNRTTKPRISHVITCFITLCATSSLPPFYLVIGWIIFLFAVGNSGNNQLRRLINLISISREKINLTFQMGLWVMLIPEGILACGKFPPIYVSDDEPQRW